MTFLRMTIWNPLSTLLVLGVVTCHANGNWIFDSNTIGLNDTDYVQLQLPVQWTSSQNAFNATKYETWNNFMDDETRAFNSEDLMLVPKYIVLDSFSTAADRWLEKEKFIYNVFIDEMGADAKSTEGTAFAFSPPSHQSLFLANSSSLLEYMSREFLKNMKSIKSSSSTGHRKKRQTVTFEDENGIRTYPGDIDRNMDLRAMVHQHGSMGVVKCDLHDEVLPCDANTPYRTYSGWCNNIRNPSWGKSVITFDRMIPSNYDDGVSKPRSIGVNGQPLPSPRQISGYVHIDVSHLSNRHTLMLMQFGQFLDHDITLTPVHKGPENKILNCRDCESYVHTHPECYPIRVPQGDSYYPMTRMENGRPYCIPFTRSLPGQQRLGPRDQINQNTAYIDASQIYGEDVCKANSLRTHNGKLNGTASVGRKAVLPQTDTLRECKSPSGYCFTAGDPRVSEQPALASLHIAFMRQHNNWAEELKMINPHWNAERIYQEVRRIMGATIQHIAYNELIPRILGPRMVSAYGLRLQNDGYFNGYNPSCSATVYNEFASAAYRFGHSIVRPYFSRMDDRYSGMTPNIQLRDGFFNSDMLYKPFMVDEVVRGLMSEPIEQVDPFVTNEITNHLFEDKRRTFSGLDLISLNIQRGRDHGLPGYNFYRSVCKLQRARNFNDLRAEIPNDVLQRLQKVYNHVDDIDLFTGGLSERPVTGGIVGPVFTCIIATQFKKLRHCDRHWYETGDKNLRFTPQQLAEIRKLTLSKVMCDNMDAPSETQRWAMDVPHNVLNPRVRCEHLAKLNLEAWRDAPAPSHRLQAPPRPQPLVAPSSNSIQTCSIGGKSIGVGGSALQSPCVSCICTSTGTKCASLRITNCGKLFQEAAYGDIMRDSVCTSQCGFQFRG